MHHTRRGGHGTPIREPGLHMTRRWREMDSNFRSPLGKNAKRRFCAKIGKSRPGPDRGMARPRPIRSSTTRQIGNTAESNPAVDTLIRPGLVSAVVADLLPPRSAGLHLKGKFAMHIIWTIIIGFIAGVIAKFVTPGDNEPSGFVLTTILGIVGAFLATYLGQAIGWYRADEGAGLIGAVVGAVIILVIWGFIAGRRRSSP